ncbi:YdhR family protein [Isoptericola sp. BMS4]|uniref:YdhR family protein n=1 Tax=Isoptericola sp. BMS4 TaxID=2527875 RepID=UPI001421044B|nr:YdhR family protein [Isoptericola sp. BMS4]
MTDLVPRPGPAPAVPAWRAVARCVAVSAILLARGRVHLSRSHVGRVVRFADGTTARVYRETTADGDVAEPCVLVVAFRLRGVRGPAGHALFRAESMLNTPLFVGFPGFVSKLWLADDQRGTYRGLYEWDGAARAEAYARSLWRVLALVSVRGSIDYRVVPGLTRDAALAVPGALAGGRPPGAGAWWVVA